MALSFTVSRAGALAKIDPAARRRVLVTGAAGNIGSYFAEHSHRRYDLRLMVMGNEGPERIDKLRPFGEVVAADLGDLDRMKEICRGVDTVLHLAARADPSTTWDELLPANVVGTYHAMVAARSAGCRRVVYASSVHAVGGYPPDVQVKTADPVNPGDLYGVSKCFGEALGRYMAEQEGLSVIALRIGAFQPAEVAEGPHGIGVMDMFVSRRDLNQLLEKSIDVENLSFAILHGVSDNRFKRLDITDARELVGYEPQDDFTELHPAFKGLKLRQTVTTGSVRDPGQKSGIREDV